MTEKDAVKCQHFAQNNWVVFACQCGSLEDLICAKSSQPISDNAKKLVYDLETMISYNGNQWIALHKDYLPTQSHTALSCSSI